MAPSATNERGRESSPLRRLRGKLLIDAITNRDFPIVQTFTAIFAGIFILSNILTDVLYALVDPRVRLS